MDKKRISGFASYIVKGEVMPNDSVQIYGAAPGSLWAESTMCETTSESKIVIDKDQIDLLDQIMSHSDALNA